MLPNDKVTPGGKERRQKIRGAEISVGKPHVAFLDGFDKFRKQTSLLGVPVFARNHVDRQSQGRIEHDQRLSRQRRHVAFPQRCDPPIGPPQMIAALGSSPGIPTTNRQLSHPFSQ
jgi:hypothetical protein